MSNQENLGFFKCTDQGNGERFAARYGHLIRYCDAIDGWLVWDGKRWAADDVCRIEALAKECTRGIYAEAARCEDDELRKTIAGWAFKSEQGPRRREMILAARSEHGIATTPDALDADPWGLNVNNGLLDLRAGTLRKHETSMMITKLAPVDYTPAANCPTWLQFLDRIMGGDQDMIAFLRRAVGYTLTGNVSERALFLLHGTGANGKSTFLETIRAMLGDYAMSAESKTLMRHGTSGASSDIARLKGARLVTANESEKGDKLAEALVKSLTGGDRRTARLLYQNEIEYEPTDKLWLATNHRPEIAGGDKAIWDRVKLIPFTVRIPEKEQDKRLKEKLIAELPGILAWAVEGCKEWQRLGLGVPEKVTTATAEYRQESDTLARFVEDCCTAHPDAKTTLKDVFADYLAWGIDNGETIMMTKREFSKALQDDMGFTKYIGTDNKTFFRGIGRKETPAPHKSNGAHADPEPEPAQERWADTVKF